MTKYYDRSGIEISSAKIRCVDSVKGTAEYTFRIVCDKCNGRGERKHFYRSRCMACKATGYSLETTRTAYTLNALYRINAQAARKVSASLQDERLRTESAHSSAFTAWCRSHQKMVDAIPQQSSSNNFLESLKSSLTHQRQLSDKQLAVAARILGIH